MSAPSPLAELNAYIRKVTPSGADGELASVRRFRDGWERGRMLDTVEHAVARKPANAGPLNSHALVLHTFDLLRALSPEYLRHALAHVQSLQWLEQARDRDAPARAPAKVRRARESAPGRRKP